MTTELPGCNATNVRLKAEFDTRTPYSRCDRVGLVDLEKRELRWVEREAQRLLHFNAMRRRRQQTRSHDACLESLAWPSGENGMYLHGATYENYENMPTC